MGCDIHCYIEYKKPTDKQARDFGGRINPGRHYPIFAKLAGVRNYNEVTPIVEPRGMPSDAGYEAQGDNQLYITHTEGDDHATPENAQRWVENGSSKYIPNHEGKNTWVTHPDWHSHSWVTADEWEQAISVSDQYVDEYKAILAALRSFEAQGYMSRVVFWFDN